MSFQAAMKAIELALQLCKLVSLNQASLLEAFKVFNFLQQFLQPERVIS